MKTKVITRAGTIIQLASLLASIVTFVLISGPTNTPASARAEAARRHTAHATKWPAGFTPHALASTAPVPEPEPEPVLPIPACEWTTAARTQLTRMVLIESSSGRDAPAIAWTMARRWRAIGRFRNLTFAQYVVQTSAILRRYEAQRAKGVEDFVAISLAGLTEHQAEVVSDGMLNHDDVANTLDAWARGDVPDPCNGSSFMWASPWFRHSSVEVSCGDTANRFYQLPSGSHDRYAARLSDEIGSCPR